MTFSHFLHDFEWHISPKIAGIGLNNSTLIKIQGHQCCISMEDFDMIYAHLIKYPLISSKCNVIQVRDKNLYHVISNYQN